MMVYTFSLPIFATDEAGAPFQVAEVDGEADVGGTREAHFVGDIRLYDLDTRRMVSVRSTDRSHGRAAWRLLTQDEEEIGRIQAEWIAHVNAHGEDGLLDAAELKWRHAYEAAS